MKKIFIFLLKIYSRTAKGRLEIFSILNEQVENTYTEQTTYGNVYITNIEFVMSNIFIKKLIKNEDIVGLSIIESGLKKSYKEALNILKSELK